MIKNYFILNKISSFKKVICLSFIFFVFNQVSYGQCTAPIAGCSNIDLMNYGSNSNNDASTIEYDNFVSAFHTTAVRTSDGSFQVWGENIGNDGASNVLSPLTINASNFPSLTTAVPLKAALGSLGSNNVQGILLATDGLYAWSREGIVLDQSLTAGTIFQKVTIDGNRNGLPAGVIPSDVKMMFATYGSLAITTCSGEVWVISQTPSVRGNGAAGNSTTWYRVTTSQFGNPPLINIVACRGSAGRLMALKSDGTVYVWGANVYIGNNTPAIPNQDRAVQMTLPASVTPKMIGSTGKSYYVLATDGNLYSLGENHYRELGDLTTIERLSWVQPRYPSSGNPVMNNIKWFSTQEHDFFFSSVNVINSDKIIYAIGNNDSSLLGTTGIYAPVDPSIPNGLTTADDILAVETGGHTSMIVKNCEANFGYVGHRISGSMGDGFSAETKETRYNFNTAGVQICGAESIPAIHSPAGQGPNSGYCFSDPVILDPTPLGGTLTVVSGPGSLTGNTLNFTGIGTVKVRYIVGTGCGAEAKIVYKEFNAVQCPLDLQITKEVDNLNPSIGDNVVFTITATNNGPYKATGVLVNDVLPAGYTFISAAPSSGTWSAPKWSIGDLSAGANAVLIVKADVKPTGPYANTAVITGNDSDTNPANNTATVTPVVQADLAVTKTVSNTAPNVGDNVTFTITASNSGPSDATGVTIQDVLPSGYTFVSAAPSAGTWSSPDWTMNRLVNGTSETLTVTAVVNAAGSYTNTADISAMEDDPQPGNNSASSTPVVNHFPIASNDDLSTFPLQEDGIDGTVNILTNDTDPDGNPAVPLNVTGQFTVDLNPALAGIQTACTDAKGSWSLNPATGIVTFDPENNFYGTALLTYTLCDAAGLCDNANITFLVTAVNDAPIANNDTDVTNEDTAVVINVVTNTAGLDTDIDGTIDAATVDLNPVAAGIQNTFTVAREGTYTVNNIGMVTFTPALNFNGTSVVNYTVRDNLGLMSNITSLTITVTPVNDAPIANDDMTVTNEDTSVMINVVNNTAGLDTDSDGTINPATVDINPAVAGIQNTFTVTGEGTYTVNNIGMVTFTPALNFNGTSIASYTVQDNLGLTSNTAALIITIIPTANQTPIALDDINNAVSSTDGPSAVNALKGTDTDGTIASYTIVTLPAHGLLALSGAPVIVNQVLTPVEAALLTYDPDGTFTGNDTFTFTVTDNKGAADPSPAVITMIISNALLQAVNDPLSLADGINGSLQLVNVLNNDTLNGAAVLSSEVIISGINFPSGITLNRDGTIDTAPNTAPGNYTLTYQICEKANPTNCSTATVEIFIETPAVAIVKTGVLNDINGNGYAEAGETITYSFTITNTGNTDLQNITVSDPLPGIVISGGPVSLAAGQSDNSSFTAVYTLAQTDVNYGSITNQAAVSAVTNSGIAVQDKSDFADPAADNPTVIELIGCVVKIFNAVSANGDQDNNRFYIQGMECYPENTVQIYNRWGVLVFEKEHYNNNDIAFKGISEGRVTIKDSNGLPEGTYYYIIKYKDKQSKPQQKAGYLYLTK